MRALWGVVLVLGQIAGCSGGGDGPEFSSDHPRIYISSHKAALSDALSKGQPAAMRFKASVDRWVGGADVYNLSPWNAALLGQLTGDPKYCTAAVKAVDQQVSDAESQIASNNNPEVAGDSYLQVGNLIGNLALVYDWCAGSLAADRRGAWLSYADQAVFNVWHPMTAKWGGRTATWSGWAIDDPSDNYYYAFMRATMLLGLAAHDETPMASGWLTQFQDKLNNELVPTFDMELVGGGSREGTGYGVAQRDMFELYDFWAASTGQRIADLTPHTRASMLSMIHQIVPTLDRFAPTGDQSRDSTAAFYDYHRNYLQSLIALYPKDPVAPHAQALLAGSSLPKMSSEFMFVSDFLYANSDVPTTTLDGLGTAYYAPGIGELYARSGWDKHATWVNLIAGPYTQSHAHQDQGSILLYKDGWLAYDAVIDSHSGLPQETTAHSVVRIVASDGKTTVEQKTGTESKLVALHRGTGFLHAAADVTAAYGKQSLVSKVQREMVFLQPDTIVVYDRVTTQAGSQVFQLVTPATPTIVGNVADLLTQNHRLTVNSVLLPTGTTAAATSMTSVMTSAGPDDFNAGFRFDETMPGGDNRALHVLTIDSAATGIVSNNPDEVTLTLGSQTVTILFNHSSIGAKVTIGNQSTTLGAGVDTLPE
jgi:Heparinase II/III-like protein